MERGRDTEVPAKATRHRFTLEYKQRIVREADGCKQAGESGALLRREVFDRFPDRIALVWGDDLHQRQRSPTFPVISRATLAALGWATSPELHHFHIESHLHDVFRRLARLGHERRVFLPDLVFEHHFAVGGAHDSQDGRRARTAQRDRITYGLLAEERVPAALRLRDAIAGRAGAAEGVSIARATHRPVPLPFAIEAIGEMPRAPRLSLLLVSNETLLPPYGAGARVEAPRDLATLGFEPGVETEASLVRWRAGPLGAALADAVSRARGEALLVLPLAECVAHAGVQRALDALGSDEHLAALVPVIVEARNGLVRRRYAWIERRADREVVREAGRGEPFAAPAGAAQQSGNVDAGIAPGAGLYGLVLRRDALVQAGGLDATLSSELLLGLDACERLVAAGHVVIADAASAVALPPEDTACDATELARVAAKRPPTAPR